jgi:hypothetical protein
MIRKRESHIALPVTIRFDARKVMVTVDWTVLDHERGKRHIPIGHTFRRSKTTMGERISPKTVLREVTTQPFSSHEWFGHDVGGRLGHEQGIEQP